MIHPEAPTFEDHCSKTLQGLQVALIELYRATGAAPDAPQDISREYGVNRNLSWKVSRIMRAEDPYAVFYHLPGMAGLHILLDAFLSAGAPPDKLEAVRSAISEFEQMVSMHAGDRQTLELMLDSLAPTDALSEPLEVSRKLAFRGNSGIWGVQAKLRLRTVLLAPNPDDPDMLDIAQVSGLLGLRRFRHEAVWPLFLKEDFNDDGTRRVNQEIPIDPNLEDAATMLMPEFCSTPLPQIRATPTSRGTRYEQVGGKLGNFGSSTCVFGSFRRHFAPRHQDGQNVRGEFFSPMNAPVEHLLFDVIVHKDLIAEGLELKAEVLQADVSSPFFNRHGEGLPCPERVKRLGPSPHQTVNPLAPKYGEILQQVYRRLDWTPGDFRGLRYEMRYPPLPCTIVLSYGLPVKRS